MSGGAGGGVSHGRVHVVGNVPAHVPGGGEAPHVELQIGVDAAGRYVVLIRQIVQCARIVGECAANKAISRPAEHEGGSAADAHRARRRAGGGESFLAYAHACQTRP